MKKCRYRVEVATQDLEKKKQELIHYKEWRIHEEQRRYDEIINTQVKQFDLDILKQTIAQLREKDLILQEAINKAEEHLEETERQLEEAQQQHLLTVRAVQKFEEFTDAINLEEAKEKAYREEQELEEFTPRNRF